MAHQIIRKTLGAGLLGALCLFAVPVNAGTLATALLPACPGCSQNDWGFTVYVSNLGRHAETFHLDCFKETGSSIMSVEESFTIDPGASFKRDVYIGTLDFLSLRCEIEFQGSANAWRLLLCNYDSISNGLSSDQCIEGH